MHSLSRFAVRFITLTLTFAFGATLFGRITVRARRIWQVVQRRSRHRAVSLQRRRGAGGTRDRLGGGRDRQGALPASTPPGSRPAGRRSRASARVRLWWRSACRQGTSRAVRLCSPSTRRACRSWLRPRGRWPWPETVGGRARTQGRIALSGASTAGPDRPGSLTPAGVVAAQRRAQGDGRGVHPGGDDDLDRKRRTPRRGSGVVAVPAAPGPSSTNAAPLSRPAVRPRRPRLPPRRRRPSPPASRLRAPRRPKRPRCRRRPPRRRSAGTPPPIAPAGGTAAVAGTDVTSGTGTVATEATPGVTAAQATNVPANPFSPTSFWNAPVAATSALDPNSQTLRQRSGESGDDLRRMVEHHGIQRPGVCRAGGPADGERAPDVVGPRPATGVQRRAYPAGRQAGSRRRRQPHACGSRRPTSCGTSGS